jgi:hypothetical protein
MILIRRRSSSASDQSQSMVIDFRGSLMAGLSWTLILTVLIRGVDTGQPPFQNGREHVRNVLAHEAFEAAWSKLREGGVCC